MPVISQILELITPAEVVGLFALLIGLVSFLSVSLRILKGSFAVSTALWAVQALLLGQYGAAASMAVAALRQALSLDTANYSHKRRAAIALAFAGATFFLFIFQWETPAEWLILVASLLGTYGFFYLGNKGLRKLLIVTVSLYIGYGVLIGAWTLVVSCVMDLGAAAIGYMRVLRSERRFRSAEPHAER